MEWHSLPDKSEGLAQVVSMELNSIADRVAKDPSKWRNPHMLELTLTWELREDRFKLEMNMDKVTVRQRMLIELTGAPPPAGKGTVDWGPNRNQSLKDTIKALGLDTVKKFNFSMFNNQMAWVMTSNSDYQGRTFTEVSRTFEAEAGRKSYEARSLNGKG